MSVWSAEGKQGAPVVSLGDAWPLDTRPGNLTRGAKQFLSRVFSCSENQSAQGTHSKFKASSEFNILRPKQPVNLDTVNVHYVW